MRKCLVWLCLMILLCSACGSACGEVQRNPLLDEAFAMLQENNGIVAKYNQITGAEVKAYFPEGIPYFFGGQQRNWVFGKWPRLVVRDPIQNSVYYKKEKRYFTGFDCTGFVKAVYEANGIKFNGKISDRLRMTWCEDGHIFCSHAKPMPEDWTELAASLQVGDVFVLRHPGTHVMMFIGTLRDYGYTAQDCEALADYLDYPLMIHSSNAPGYFDRYQEVIRNSEENYIRQTVTPPDGGVSIAILGVPKEKAEHEGQLQDAYLYWDVLQPDIAPCIVTIQNLSGIVEYAWVRPNVQ